jgi:hypothetical protein
MDESLVLKQDYAKPFHIVSNTYRKHSPTSTLQIPTLSNPYGSIGGYFGGLVDILTKMGLVNGCKPSFGARPSGSTSNCLQYIQKE